MSADDSGADAPVKDVQDSACGCCCRPGGPGRNCLRRMLVLLLALIVLGGGGAYWWFFTRVYGLDVYRSAMKTIQGDAGLRQQLGEPIGPIGWRPPNARVEAGEKDVLWDIAGPQGRAKAHVFARLMMGNWETVVLEVVLPDGKKVSLAEQGGGAADAPAFQGSKPKTKQPEANAPAPEINLPIPSDGGPGS